MMLKDRQEHGRGLSFRHRDPAPQPGGPRQFRSFRNGASARFRRTRTGKPRPRTTSAASNPAEPQLRGLPRERRPVPGSADDLLPDGPAANRGVIVRPVTSVPKPKPGKETPMTRATLYGNRLRSLALASPTGIGAASRQRVALDTDDLSRWTTSLTQIRDMTPEWGVQGADAFKTSSDAGVPVFYLDVRKPEEWEKGVVRGRGENPPDRAGNAGGPCQTAKGQDRRSSRSTASPATARRWPCRCCISWDMRTPSA